MPGWNIDICERSVSSADLICTSTDLSLGVWSPRHLTVGGVMVMILVYCLFYRTHTDVLENTTTITTSQTNDTAHTWQTSFSLAVGFSYSTAATTYS